MAFDSHHYQDVLDAEDLPLGTEARVCADIIERQEIGIKKYGTIVSLNPIDLKAWLRHAYEECLDQAIYLRRAIEEIEKNEKTEKMMTNEQVWEHLRKVKEGIVLSSQTDDLYMHARFGGIFEALCMVIGVKEKKAWKILNKKQNKGE